MKPDNRRQALLRMSLFASLLMIAGHTVLGFEQSWGQVVAALLTAYSADFLLETLDARASGRPPRYRGDRTALSTFFLSAHLTGLSVALLLFPGQRTWPMVFAALAGIGSKYIFRVPTERGSRHVFNPSNFGIAVSLLLFPTVGVAPPYMFTENLSGALDWIVPAAVSCIGIFLNAKFTGRLPMVIAWVATFAAQAAVRSLLLGIPLAAGLMPMTGFAFLLYSLYMVTDPATTPAAPRQQALFGAAVALVYGFLQVVHVVFGLFFALVIVSAGYGAILYASRLRAANSREKETNARLAVGEVRP